MCRELSWEPLALPAQKKQKMPTQCDLLEWKVIPDLTALHSRAEAHKAKPEHRMCSETLAQAHTCSTSCVSLPTWCHHKPALLWLLRADTKRWPVVCSHLYRPVLPCPLQCFIFLMELCCHIHHHRVTEVSSVLTGSQKKVKNSFNRLLPVPCYINNGITLQSFILGIYHCTTTQVPDTAPGWCDPEPTKTNTTFSRS